MRGQEMYKEGDEYQLVKGLAQEPTLALSIVPLPNKVKASPFGQKVEELLDLSKDVLELDDSDVVRFELSVSTVTPEPYPFMFSLDWRSTYKSLFLGWWLVTWAVDERPWQIRDLSVEFQPGL